MGIVMLRDALGLQWQSMKASAASVLIMLIRKKLVEVF